MARGNQNTNPNDSAEDDFPVETLISRLDRIHHVLKEVEEIKDSLVCIAKQRVEVERQMHRQGQELKRAEKKIEDLNKENEQLKGACFRRCSVELKRTPLLELRRNTCAQNVAETVSRPQSDKESFSVPKLEQENNSSQDINVEDSSDDLKPVLELIDHHDNPSLLPLEYQLTSANGGICELPVEAPSSSASSEGMRADSMDFLPVCKTEDQLFHAEDFGNLELAGPSSDDFSSSKDVQGQRCVTDLLVQQVQHIKEEQFEVEYSPDEEILVPDGTDELSAQEIEDQDSTDIDIIQHLNEGEGSSMYVFEPGSKSNEEFERAGPSQAGSQTYPSPAMNFNEICRVCFSTCDWLQDHTKCHGDGTGQKRHKCTQCSYSAGSSSRLRNHQRTHTKEKPYVCQVCHKGFALKGALSYHTLTHNRPFKCDRCHKSYTSGEALDRHMRMHRKEEKPYKCDLCNKGYKHSDGLQAHNRLHTEWKPYACDVCEMTFARVSSLHNHKKNMHFKGKRSLTSFTERGNS